jgi:hypothetical protein
MLFFSPGSSSLKIEFLTLFIGDLFLLVVIPLILLFSSIQTAFELGKSFFSYPRYFLMRLNELYPRQA